MKSLTLCVAPILVFMAVLVSAPLYAANQADGAIVRISAVTSPRLGIYQRAADDSKLKEISKEGVKMPLDVFDTSEDELFLKVKIDGDSFWVRQAQVSILRAVTSGCLAQGTAPKDTAGIRGANRGCAK